MKHQYGYSLIELVIFIIIMGILSSSLLVGLNQATKFSGSPKYLQQASYLANARMQIILMNRHFNGYAALNDPCTVTPALAVCTLLDSYETANGFTVSTPVISGSNPKTITVSVSGNGSVTVTSSIYNYANN